MTPPAAVLFLEDSDLDAELVAERLSRSGLALAVERVSDRRGFEAKLAGARSDVILSDYQLPGFDGLAALALAREHQPDAPFIFVSGMMGEELAVESLKRGATDYILKQRLARLPAAIERALAESRAQADRKGVEAERQKFVSLADNSTEFIGLCDLTGVIIYGNPVGMKLVGVDSLREFCNTPIQEFFFPEDRDFLSDVFLPAVRRDGHGETEIRFRHFKTGAPVWMICNMFLVYDTHGRPVALATVSRDITERRRAEEALRDADRRKDEFLATLAHELRNPLAPIRNGLALLRRDPAGASAPKALAMMERQLEHMVRLLDDLLDIARVSRGTVELRRQRVQLRTVVEHAVETSRPVVEAGRHAFTVSLPNEPVWLDADLTRLAQVLSNVLINAAKYTPEGGSITLVARREGGEAVVAVTDTGVGIAADMLGRVFEMFAQVTKSIDRAQGGLGIGLALVKRLVEMHGGTIAADSPGLGRGSTFTVRLPLAAEAGGTPPSRPGAAVLAPPVDRRRVLVVDDNRDGAESLAMLLEIAGHEIRTAYSGPEALAAARIFFPEVAFLDIGLPGMDGHEVARQLRADPALGGILLVALTGLGSVDDRSRSSEAGFDHHLTKPAEAATIQGLLGQYARRGSPSPVLLPAPGG